MLELLGPYDGSQAARQNICQAFDQRLAQLRNDGHYSDRNQVARVEEMVAGNPQQAFQFDAQGWARLQAGDKSWQAGRFACKSLRQLRQHGKGGLVRLWVLVGGSPVTDVGALQAVAPVDSLFQVASQFNCLESPGPSLVPVQHYFFDPTQGPRASISAYPGTLLRHYAAPAPDGRRFTQHDSEQLNLLHRVTLDGVARVESGYLLAENIKDRATFASLLQEHFEDLEVGVHEGVQVVLGADWHEPVPGVRRIDQVFTSTLAAGGYSRVDFADPNWSLICRQLQRAAYLGTLLAAAARGQQRAVLTLIGGGVFGNPLPTIWDALLWACDEVAPCLHRDLTVIVNGRNLSRDIDMKEVRHSAQQRGGEVIVCSAQGAHFES